MKTFKEHVDSLKEEAPANVAASGAVAGITGEPPVRKKKTVMLSRKPLDIHK